MLYGGGGMLRFRIMCQGHPNIINFDLLTSYISIKFDLVIEFRWNFITQMQIKVNNILHLVSVTQIAYTNYFLVFDETVHCIPAVNVIPLLCQDSCFRG